ncbi:GNAT family N-acetyltransferase [Cellulomonas sp. NPDC057328]|uniref:GNAT family N-acetyltransferase n=1 Tax=Cellulomonas sp. NPDC057328 TaxID=3346101 RepID=UPI00363FBBCB
MDVHRGPARRRPDAGTGALGGLPAVRVGSPVHLRPLTHDDVPVLASWADDVELCREAGWSTGLARERHVAFWRGVVDAPPPELLRLGAVSEGALVGYVDLHGLGPARRELGVLIGVRARWGDGLGRQAAAAALDHGFGALGLTEVWAEALDANGRSVRLLRRLGMRETGRGGEEDFLGRPSFYRQFTVTSAEWRRSS